MTHTRRWSLSLIALFFAVSLAADDCKPVDRQQVLDAARTWLKVPADASFELVSSQPVGTSCYSRLMFETVDARQIREWTVFLSPDRRFLSRDLFGLDGDTAPPATFELASLPADQPSLGEAAAKLTLVVFSDFECGYCRNAAGTLSQLAATDPNVRVMFRHMPLANHPWALYAARATSCLRGENFWKLHDYYFENQRELKFETIAEKTNEFVRTLSAVDTSAFNACLASDTSLNAVRRDVRAAALLGVNGTPTIFANGKRLRPAGNLEALRKEIQLATGLTVVAPGEEGTYLVFLRPTGRRSSPDIDRNAEAFLAKLKEKGGLVSVGRAEAANGAFDVLTVRAADANAAMKLVSASPLIAGGIAKPEIMSFRNAADPAKAGD